MLCSLLNKRVLLIFGLLIFVLNVNLVFAELNYTTGNAVYGVLADSGNMNITGALNLTLQITTCSLANCSDANWSVIYTNNSYNSLASLANATYFQYKATFFTENQNYSPLLFNATIDYTYLDTTFPLLEFVSPTPANNSGASGSFVINVSITEDGLANVTLNWNGTLKTFNSSNESLHNLGSGNWAFTYTQSGLAVGQSYNYNVSVSDYAGNVNTTETRRVNGNTVPTVYMLTQSITDNDLLDPGTTVVFIANISDTTTNFDTAIFQWRNSTANDWTNVTMINQTSKTGIYTLVNTSFTLPSYETNITYRIWMNDSVDSNSTGNYTIQNFWDCTWTSTSDLGPTAGYGQNKGLGNITINNTGDTQYTNNGCSGCSLNFHLAHNLDGTDTSGYKRIYFNNWQNNRWYDYYDTSSVSANSSYSVQVNATFLTTIKQEDIIISIAESSTCSSTSSRNTTATLVTNQNTPYLYQKITQNPASVYLSSGNSLELQAYLRNLMGSTTINENYTAYNVSFNWTIPSELINASGNLSVFYENITSNNLNYNNINLTFSSLATATSGVKEITLFAQGYNITGSLIRDASGNTNLTDTISISFLCYNVSDSICVTSCGYTQDPDCSAPSTSSGGSGGGSGVSLAVAVATSADYHLVRGKQDKVDIVFENNNKNESLRDLSFSVSGKISKYIDINPKTLSELAPDQKAIITLTIVSPTYIDLGKQELIIMLSGKKGSSSYTDSKKITLEIHELSIEEANQMLNESKELIKQLNEINFSSDYLNELLNKSKTEINNFNLEAVKTNYNIIKEQAGYALDSNKIITELESLIKSAEDKGIDVSESARLLELAKLSMERREFEQAYKRVKDSQLTYALEVKGEFGKLSYYLKEYPKEISFGAFFLVIFSFGAYNINKLRLIKKRIKELKEEEKILNELIRVVQNQCFKEKKMSMNEYEVAMKEYNLKLSGVVEELIELETKRTQMLRFASKTKRLKLEKEKIISLIEELQGDYMKKKKLETRTYEFKMDSFNKRLSEIEEKLATLEAKKAVKGLGISLKIPKGK